MSALNEDIRGSLSNLSDNPNRYSACCLSLSLTLYRTLEQLLKDICFERSQIFKVLSIGCGSGFFEELLQQYLLAQDISNILIVGVEVQSKPVIYLPQDRVRRVNGTWDFCDDAAEADVLVFVYPRTGELVRQYFEKCAFTRIVIWLGPIADWDEQEAILSDVPFFEGPIAQEDAGLASYEKLVIFRSKRDQ